jgi:hypothetical protein
MKVKRCFWCKNYSEKGRLGGLGFGEISCSRVVSNGEKVYGIDICQIPDEFENNTPSLKFRDPQPGDTL